MHIGVNVGGTPPFEEILATVRAAGELGLDSVSFNQVLGWDVLTLAGVAGREAPGLEVITAVVPTYSRHPVALAQQALTVAAATGGRLVLGVGPSHAAVVEKVYGASPERPVRHVREYLGALLPLLRGESIEFAGETLKSTAVVEVPHAEAPPVLLSALRPAMLELAGSTVDGIVTVWTTAEFIATNIAPRLTEAARAANRPRPRIAALVTAAAAADPVGVSRQVAERTAVASDLANYRALLALQALAGVHQTAVIGSETAVAEGLRAYASAGVTDLLISLAGDARDRTRTLALLADLRRDLS
ncbi:TIGR03564 family F420-dependent LLM class oxidoreductase [Nocardia miyunensis]|uniref:TIGR03564 family F420-dependent LLM class oxidoreductase n=1 Tax=Nocardia miyunensis TaxID=282684 RepID=UPI0008298499|nr:TIGR03564 family F420-dependent LLM class oxidoreductase [Nocardia miyunensis]